MDEKFELINYLSLSNFREVLTFYYWHKVLNFLAAAFSEKRISCDWEILKVRTHLEKRKGSLSWVILNYT